MRKRRGMLILMLLAALALSGCGEKKEEAAATAEPEDTREQIASVVPQAQGALGDSVRALLEPYGKILSQAAESSGSLAYTIPSDVLNRMALDAEAEKAQALEGRWRFISRESGDYSYEATAWEAMEQYVPEDGPTPDPKDETPLDSQLNGDYIVSGGGLFQRERQYDVGEDLSGGTAVFTDSLNGETTGYELFRFTVRNGELFFADAVLDETVQEGEEPVQDSYLAAVGVLRADGLETAEYRIPDPSQLPDPESLDLTRLLLTVSPVSHVSLQISQTR